MKRRRAVIWATQVLVFGVVAGFVWRTLATRWTEFRAIDFALTIHPGWLALSIVVVLTTYGLLVQAWRDLLQGWGPGLHYPVAVRIWTLANLGRYVPGKVWSIAGLAVLAQRAGVAGWAAAGSALVMQAIAIGTGIAIVAATAPGVVSGVWLALAAAMALGTVLFLSWPAGVRGIARLAGRTEVRPLPWPALARATAVTTVSWLAYGVAFWCLARGTLGGGAEALRLPTAVGIFAAGYIVGLIALFAPGGLGVREAVFLGLLTPSLGAGGAIALAAGSRVLLTLTEILAALVGLVVRHPTKEHRIG